MKGDFEIDKEFHKDPSMRIVPLAVKEYLVYGIPVEKTIKENRDIFNFCMRLKTNSLSTPYFRHITDKGLVDDKLNRTTRYYISNKKGSGILLKKFSDGRVTGVNVGNSVMLFNKYFPVEKWEDYEINYNFYISEANKLKESTIGRQVTLFDLFY